MAIIELLKGIISDFIYRNQETGYAVLSCSTEIGHATLIGDFASAVKGKRAMYRVVEHEAATKRQTMLEEWLTGTEREEK